MKICRNEIDSSYIIRLFSILLIGIYSLYILYFVASCVKDYIWDGGYDFREWEISDWLINYEAGFVRRGLIGELLFFLYGLIEYDVRWFILIVVSLSSLLMLYLLARMFVKEDWLYVIIPTGLCVGYTLFNIWSRRDMISLIFTYYIFMIYSQNREQGFVRIKTIILFYILSILSILMHEACFFYTFPILVYDYYTLMKMKYFSERKSLIKVLSYFLPIFICFIAVTTNKGSSVISAKIWESWSEMFLAYSPNTVSDVGLGVDALKWSLADAAKHHLTASYIGVSNPSLWKIPLMVSNFVLVYFLYSRINRNRFFPKYALQSNDCLQIQLSNVILFQFVCMIPMFTVLSCDWGRTIPYWGLSSLFFYHHLHDKVVFPSGINTISTLIQKNIDRVSWFNSFWFYVLILLLTPIPRYYALDDLSPKLLIGPFYTLFYIVSNLL